MRRSVWVGLVVLALLCGGAGLYVVPPLRAQLAANEECCQIPFPRSIGVATAELMGRTYPSQIGQDKWVLETVFPGVTDGYFLDVGSGDGIFHSNTVELERRGWKGICVDPFPTHMETRTCQMFTEVVWSVPGRVMTFQKAEGIGGLADTLERWKDEAMKAPSVEMTTTTLDDILTRAKAPSFIHFMSLDIEGAELEALRAFPFDKIRLGALAIEHNYEEPKRTQLIEFLSERGYRRTHEFNQDDFFVPTSVN
jgi:FkbM family methyltransferase